MWLSRNDECRFYEVHSPNTKEQGWKKKSPPPPHSWLQAATVYSSQPELYIDHCQAAGLQYTCDLSPSTHSKPLPALLHLSPATLLLF